jgi:N-acetylmuramoyl-L-alanine amidase
MGKVAKLHNRKPINTSLAVLRSPQIPSVLVETGFISNPTEERLLFQRSHQDKLATAITTAVVKYLKANPPEGIVLSNTARPTSAPVASTITHKVSRGESLSVIAKKYGTTTQNLVAMNNLKSTSLAIGQKLKVPGTNQTTSNNVERRTVTHVVQRGEYLGGIANKYGVTVSAIKRENNLRSDVLKVGQKLKITISVKALPLRKHKVVRGDYLGKIASKYGVTVDSIRKANKLRSDGLAVGQVLVIPHK